MFYYSLWRCVCFVVSFYLPRASQLFGCIICDDPNPWVSGGWGPEGDMYLHGPVGRAAPTCRSVTRGVFSRRVGRFSDSLRPLRSDQALGTLQTMAPEVIACAKSDWLKDLKLEAVHDGKKAGYGPQADWCLAVDRGWDFK